MPDSVLPLEDHDGFISELYYLLWLKNSKGETCPGMLLPDVILYKYRIPAYWYFTAMDGSLKRKSKSSIVNKKIFADFTKGTSNSCDGEPLPPRKWLAVWTHHVHGSQSSPTTYASNDASRACPRLASVILTQRVFMTFSSTRRSSTMAAFRSSSTRRAPTTP